MLMLKEVLWRISCISESSRSTDDNELNFDTVVSDFEPKSRKYVLFWV